MRPFGRPPQQQGILYLADWATVNKNLPHSPFPAKRFCPASRHRPALPVMGGGKMILPGSVTVYSLTFVCSVSTF